MRLAVAQKNRLLPLCLLASSLGVSGATGCTEGRRPPPQPKPAATGGTLRVYNFESYLGATAVSTFEERSNAKVQLETYKSNEDLVRGLEGGGRYDVIFPSSYAVERLVQRGLLREMDRERVPNLIQVPERFRNPPVDPGLRHCVPYTWSMTGLGLLSPRTSRARDPDSLSALFADRAAEKPTERGAERAEAKAERVLMLDDMRATMGVALRYLGLPASTQKPEEVTRAKDLLLGQAPRVARYVSDVGPPLAAGEARLALAWSGDVLEQVQRNPDLRFVVPREGTILYVDYACVPRSAPSPELAFAFLNHLLDPQIAADFTNTTMFATPNLGAQKLLHPEARWLWATLDAVKDQGRFEMLRDVGPAAPLYEAAWREVRARSAAPAR